MNSQLQQQIQVLSQALNEATEKHNQEDRKQEWETFRTHLQTETQLAIAQLKTGSQEAIELNNMVMDEMRRLREMWEQQLMQPKSDSGAGPSPQAQPPVPAPQVPPQQQPSEGVTPAVVGNGPTQ
jgi:hypothetical protein